MKLVSNDTKEQCKSQLLHIVPAVQTCLVIRRNYLIKEGHSAALWVEGVRGQFEANHVLLYIMVYIGAFI